MKHGSLYGTHFCGNKASDYAIENGYLDYATLSKAFDSVLNNGIMEITCNIGYWEQENGFIDNSEEIEEIEEEIDFKESQIEILEEEIENSAENTTDLEKQLETIKEELEELEERKEELENESNDEIFQYFIISDSGAEILKDWTNEIVFYNEELDMYVWGVTHYGTSWSYVLTNIKLNCGEDAFK